MNGSNSYDMLLFEEMWVWLIDCDDFELSLWRESLYLLRWLLSMLNYLNEEEFSEIMFEKLP